MRIARACALAVAALVLLVGGCETARRPPGAEVAAVYDAFLDEPWAWRRGPLLLLSQTDTVSPDVLSDTWGSEDVSGGFSPDVQQALADLFARSQQPSPMLPSALLSTPHQRIAPDSLARIGERLTRVRETTSVLPDSALVVGLSPVGFNRERTVAVVFGRSVCGMLCGAGEIRVLRKQQGRWLPAERLVWMVS